VEPTQEHAIQYITMTRFSFHSDTTMPKAADGTMEALRAQLAEMNRKYCEAMMQNHHLTNDLMIMKVACRSMRHELTQIKEKKMRRYKIEK